jgi:hypothetical protein
MKIDSREDKLSLKNNVKLAALEKKLNQKK